jgi:FG-GAP repeat
MRTLPRFALLAALTSGLYVPSAQAANFTLRQEIIAPATGEGAPARSFGNAVAVDGDLAVVSDLGATLGVRRATVRTYVRTGGTWVRQSQVLSIDTGSPSNKIKLALGDGTLALFYPTNTGGTQRRIYRWVSGRWDLETSGGGSDVFESVAAEGTIVVFGHPGTNVSNPNFTSGFVRVYRRDQAGTWPSTQITPSGGQANQRFGHSVAIVAGAIAVGSPALDVTHSGNGQVFTDAGGAYVFELTGDTWAQAARLVEPDTELDFGIGFGNAVAISGADPATPDRMLVSSQHNRNNVGTHVRSYTQTADVWTPRQVFSSNTDDCFGCTMSLDGNWAVLGAPDSHVTANFAGKVVVMQFASNFLSVLSTTDRFDAAGGTNDYMGTAASIDRSGPTLFVGAPGAEVYGNPSEGVVMVGRGGEFGDPVPRTIRTLDLGQGLTNAIHGYTIDSDGDTLAIGAPQEDVGLQQSQGAAYVRQRDASGVYGAPLRLLAPDGITDDQYGSAVALRGDLLLVGAANRTVQGVHESGTVYAFRRTAGIWNLEAQLIPSTLTPSGGFGQAIAFDGSTAIICGRVTTNSWVFERNAGGTWTQTQILDRRCATPQLAGDLLVLNDLSAAAPAPDSGEVTTWVRSGGTWTRQGSLSGNVADRRFGAQIALEGDLLAVSSVGDPAQPVQLYRRNGSTWLPEASVLPLDINNETYCLAPAIRAGRLLLGCDNLPGPNGPGAVYVFERPAGTWTQTQKLTHAGGRDGEGFGGTLDVHADGTLFIAAIREAVTFFAQGVVYAYAEPALLSDGFEGD